MSRRASRPINPVAAAAEASVRGGQEEGLDRQHGPTARSGGHALVAKRPRACECPRGFLENAWGLCKTCGGTRPVKP